MLTVPRTPDTQVAEAPLPTVRRQPLATEETFGGGASSQAVTTAFRGLAYEGARLALASQKGAAEVKAQEIDNQAGMLETDLQVGVSKMQGKDAFGAQEYLDKTWSEATKKMVKDIQDPYTAGLVNKKLQARYQSLYKYTQVHTATEADNYDKQTTQGSVDVARNQAILNYNNPDEVQKSLYIQANAWASYGERKGLDLKDPQLQTQINEDISKTVGQVYKRLLFSGDEKSAEELRTRFSKHLQGPDVIAMDEAKEKQLNKIAKEEIDEIQLSQQNVGTDLINQTLSGKFDDISELERLRALGAAGSPQGITDSVHSVVKRYLNDPQVQAANEAKMALTYGMPEAYFNIDADQDNEVDKNVRYAQIAQFQAAAFEAYQNGAITKAQLQAKLDNVKSTFDKGLSEIASEKHKSGQSVWRFTKDWFKQNLSGIQVVEGNQVFKQAISPAEETEALSYVGTRLMDYMRANDVKESDVPAISQLLLGQWLVKRYPKFAGMTSLPNAIANAEVSFKKLYPGKSELTPDSTIKGPSTPPQYDPNTQKLQYNRKTGAYRVVPK